MKHEELTKAIIGAAKGSWLLNLKAHSASGQARHRKASHFETKPWLPLT